MTRPGGIYYPLDFNTGGVKSPGRAMYSRWMDHRWNNEVWSIEYHSVTFSDEIAKRGFTRRRSPPWRCRASACGTSSATPRSGGTDASEGTLPFKRGRFRCLAVICAERKEAPSLEG